MLTTTAKIAAAATVGYVLGRSKKLKLTILATGLIAGKDLAEDAQSIRTKALERSPELRDLGSQLTEDLPHAAKDLARATSEAAAATSASVVDSAASGVEAVTGSLEDAARTLPSK
jgi:hypothetical protein